MSYTEPLYPNSYYHIFNRGNNSEDLFLCDENYQYFLTLYKKYISRRADTFSYCLMKNHFHFLIRVNENRSEKPLSQRFSNFFNAYTKAFNKSTNRHGSLFEKPFKRKRIKNQAHLIQVVYYIHANPVKHRCANRFSEWKYSSYHAYESDHNTLIKKEECLSWFSGPEGFIKVHQEMTENKINRELELNQLDVT
ncbi:transposase [bacterium]|nr:transposase [bacterium]